jgi:heme-degrading monooxygenase HmoA
VLDALVDGTRGFERAFAEASASISSSPGYISHELQRCIEKPGRYVLPVRWETLRDHTEGFRGSAGYEEWGRPFHHFCDPFQTVQHSETVHAG